MSPEMKSYFGDEYPVAVITDGVRLPLVSERRWTRIYSSKESKMTCVVSRFMDGSAVIRYPEFVSEWSAWSEQERMDFCGACGWLHEQVDFPEMLRYIMEHGDPCHWSSIANSVGMRLPMDEAFELLTRALRSTELPRACNIVQGISLTKHPEVERVLRAHLAALWSHPALWEEDSFNNWFAYGATCCIQHLIETGAPAEDFSGQVRKLAGHACAGNRKSCRRFLAKHFPWLKEAS